MTRGAGGTQLTQLPTEYTEFNGSQTSALNQWSMVKQRRSRAQRSSQKSATNSSSGANIGGATVSSIYEYNQNQLAGQYGNGRSQAVAQTDDLELGITSATNFSINNF